MAAGPVTMNVKANPNSTAPATNRYSLFDGLDHIANTHPDLTLGPPTFRSARRIQDESIRRLSKSLNDLISQQHGRNQLPELPVPTYDNGNVDLSIVQPPRRQSPLVPQVESQTRLRQTVAAYKPEPEAFRSPRVSDISSELDEPIDHNTFGAASHLLAHVDVPVQTRYYGSLPCPATQKSRPVSMYSSSTTRRTRCYTRPDTSGSQACQSKSHKKAISYSDQRYTSTRQQDQCCQQDLLVRQDSVKSQSQRRFRLLPSLKNLHAQAKLHAKRLAVEEKPVTNDRPEFESPQVMDIHSALRLRGISTLHDPDHDEHATQDQQDLLDSRPGSPRQSTRKLSAPGLLLDTEELDLAVDDAYQPITRHKSAVSEAPTVDTDILSSDWPQPPTTHPPLPTGLGHQQFGPPLAAPKSSPPQQEAGKHVLAPSPPPKYPLPPVPATSPTKQPSKRSLTNPMTGVNLGLSLKKYNLANTKTQCGKTNNRVKALAAGKGLSVDACLNNDGSSDREVAGNAGTDPLPSLLNARFNQSSRNSKVRELKKRHMSLLHKDIPASAHSNDRLQGQAVPGPGSSMIPTSLCSPITKELPKRPPPVDQRKPLPDIPASAGGTKANIGRSRHARSASAWSGEIGQQVIELDQDASLALSDVMVMVDSSPRQSRDFRAGAIRVSKQSPRMTSSITKGQTLPPLRYQPGHKRQLQPPRVPSSLVNSHRPGSGASLAITNTETRSQTDIVTTFIIPRAEPGVQSPSRASSILEPSPVSQNDTDQYKPVAQRTPTPVRHVRNRQYMPAKDRSGSCSPSAGKGRSVNGCPTPMGNEILYDEINRMVRTEHDQDTRNQSIYGSKSPSAERVREPASRQRVRPTSKSIVETTKSANELLDHIEADLVKANLSANNLSARSSKHSTTLQPYNNDDESDMSITPKSSFRSTSSESSNKQVRKNSDASMTDPNDYEGAAKPAKETGRVIILPTPPRSRAVDTTVIKSKKRYSNMPSWAYRNKATAPSTVHSDPIPVRESPYTFSRQDVFTAHSSPTKFSRAGSRNTRASSRQLVSTPESSSDIELNHFLTEADQMDNAIESFIQSTSGSTVSTISSCRSKPRTRLPIAAASPSLTISSQRYSAMSNMSNIIDLQRIQDQINAVANSLGDSLGTVDADATATAVEYTSEAERSVIYGLAMGAACRDEEGDGFGRISLVVSPRTT